MAKKTIKCPHCGNISTVVGSPGDTIDITCSHCKEKGVYVFPSDKQDSLRTDDSSAISVTHLTKMYQKTKAVDNISFTVKKGEVFGFLGPNGAGKTTTIKAMLDLIHVDAGEITIHGIDVQKKGKEARRYVGYLPEKVAFYDNLTALQNLMFIAEMKQASKEECMSLIGELGLGDAGKKKVGKFSKGMVQRLGMARAILGNPPILILDEPSGGLDPRGVVLIRDKILELKNKGTSVFVSSHILSEIQEVCDQVGIINKGVLVAQDTVAALSQKLNLKPQITVELASMSAAIEEEVKKVKGVDKVKIQGNNIEILCDAATKAKVILAISKAGGNILNVQTKEPSLEDVFMRYTTG